MRRQSDPKSGGIVEPSPSECKAATPGRCKTCRPAVVLFISSWRYAGSSASSAPRAGGGRPRRRASEAMLVLTLILRLGLLEDNVGNGIPRVVDADEQEQHRHRTDAEQGRHRIAREQKRRDDECCVGDERKYRMPQPVFQHRLIVSLTAHTPQHDDDVGHPPETAETAQKARIPEDPPWRAENRGDQQRGANMDDGW